jgi:hypothetical protein
MNNNKFKKLQKLVQKQQKQEEKDRKTFERNANKAAKTIMNNDIKKGSNDPTAN